MISDTKVRRDPDSAQRYWCPAEFIADLRSFILMIDIPYPQVDTLRAGPNPWLDISTFCVQGECRTNIGHNTARLKMHHGQHS